MADVIPTRDGERTPPRPQYLHIADVLEERILKGIYKANDALPTFNGLSEEFGVSLVTVNRAIQELDSRGCIVRYRGKGVYVATSLSNSPNSGTGDRPLRTIGFVIPDLANPFFASMAKNIQEVLGTENFSVITHSTEGEHRRWDQYLRRLMEERVDGVILVPLDTAYTERERVLWEMKIAGLPFVYLNQSYARVPSDFVTADFTHGVREVARYLTGMGHVRLACVSAEPCVSLTLRKLRLFQETAAERGVHVPDENIIVSSLQHEEGGKEAAMRLLSRPKESRPTAIYATNDIIAFGVLSAANELGLNVPADVSVVGFDNIEGSRFMTPPLTTVVAPIEEMARRAAEILLQRIEGTLDPEYQEHVFLPSLVERSSCCPPSA
jgi:LacI family transcriptional regulator